MARKCTSKDNPNEHCIDFNKVAGCQCSLAAYEPSDECPIHGCGLHPKRCYWCNRYMKYENTQVRSKT